jgi:predicted permease
MHILLQDIRYCTRSLRKTPLFTLVALIALAIGIGANAAIFSVVNAVLLRPLPYASPDRLVMVWQSLPKMGQERLGASPPDYIDYRDRNRAFENMAGFESLDFNLAGEGTPERIKAARVTSSLFPTLGVATLLGRTISISEDQQGADKVVVLGYSLWKRRYNSDRTVLGRTITLDDQPYTVIGVMPDSFNFPFKGVPFSERSELWVPWAFSEHEKQARAESFDVRIIARLKKNVSLAQAQTDVARIAQEFQRENPQIFNGSTYVVASVSPFFADVAGKVRPILLTLLGAVGFVLLIACANVSNLLLARATVRGREFAIRTAIGASPSRLVRQLLTESIVLGLAGGTLGLLLAYWLVSLIVKFGPEQVPRIQEASVDPWVLSFASLLSLIAGVLFGLVPAFQAARLNLNQALKESAQQSGQGGGRIRHRDALVVFETASAVLLLLGAGLLINSFIRVMRVPPGFDPENVLVARTYFDRTRYPKPAIRAATEQEMTRRLAALPGVQTVGLASHLPLADERQIGFLIEGRPKNEYHWADNTLINSDYFRAMGIPLIKGRAFTDEDRPGSNNAVVINEAMARQYFSGQDPLGRQIRWGGRLPFTIVGVVADVKVSALDAATNPMVYMSRNQVESGASAQAVFVLRAEGDTLALASGARNEIWAVDKDLPVYDIRTMRQIVAESLEQRRFIVLLLSSFAGVALLLAALGLYGVIAYSVTQRTREMGLRVALGAVPRDLLMMVLKSGFRLAALGIAAGLMAGLALTRLLANMLFGIRAIDVPTFFAVGVILFSAALLASYLPARRAAKVDPMVALRYE